MILLQGKKLLKILFFWLFKWYIFTRLQKIVQTLKI